MICMNKTLKHGLASVVSDKLVAEHLNHSILRRSLISYFNYLVSVTADEPESPRAHVAKFYGGIQLICSVLRAFKFPCSNLN